MALVLERTDHEELLITTPAGEVVRIKFRMAHGTRVKVCITAPAEFRILRAEIAPLRDAIATRRGS